MSLVLIPPTSRREGLDRVAFVSEALAISDQTAQPNGMVGMHTTLPPHKGRKSLMVNWGRIETK